MKDYEAAYLELLGRLRDVEAFHAPTKSFMGMTSGYCSGCDWVWPCPTIHLANGWDHNPCIDQAWCSHEGRPYR